MERRLGACDERIAMRNRLLILLTVLALMGSACAGDVADGEIVEDRTAATTTTASDQGADLTPANPSTDSVGAGDSEDQSKAEEQAEPSEGSTTTTGATREPERVPEPIASSAVTGETPPDLLSQIIADAADRAGVADSEVTVIRDEFAIWNDGSLGCPEPGLMYTQALVDGYWIVVAIGEFEYDYRVGAGGYFKLCSRPLPPSESSGSGG